MKIIQKIIIIIIVIYSCYAITGCYQVEPSEKTAEKTDEEKITDGRKILFSSDGELCIINADGSGLTNLNKEADYPIWSPDGKRIAFITTNIENENSEIHIINTDGSENICLTSNRKILYYGDLSWSPDCKYIAFMSDHDSIIKENVPTINKDIYIVNTDNLELTRLTQNKAEDKWPIWSPDGKKIAFMSNRDGNWEIYVMNSDGSEITNITNNKADDMYPTWSPDGKRIAFTSDCDGNSEIYVMNSDGSDQTRLTENYNIDFNPVWSPDGKKIAFVSNTGTGLDIYVINSNGFNHINLTKSSEGRYGEHHSPSWSPDSEKIAYISVPHDKGEIYIVNADGSKKINLTNDPADDRFPSWQP